MNTEKELHDFYKLVNVHMSIDLHLYKQQQLTRRLYAHIKKNGYSNLYEYGDILSKDKEEREKFINFLTINVTNFFRDKKLFEYLGEILKSNFSDNVKSLKIWSAGCSMGCEAYSLAILLKETFGDNYRFNIYASDIDNDIVNKAKLGQYGENELREMSPEYIKKYFIYSNNKYQIKPEFKSNIKFDIHNLLLDPFDKNYDLILCRNVVIYFTEEAQRELYDNFAKALRVGGLLFVGATESIFNYKEYGFEKLSMYIYIKKF